MKKKSAKSPLVYVLAQVKISPISQIKAYVGELQESIRKEFPLFNTINIQSVEIKPLGKSDFNIENIEQWHFSDKTSTTGIIVDTNNITIHTTAHNSFQSLIEMFDDVLEKFNNKLEISLYTRLGLRYVNVITDPKKYLNDRLLGFNLGESKEFKKTFLTSIDTIQQTNCGLIKIKSSHFSDKSLIRYSREKELLIPPDLIQSANYLSLDAHNEKIPSGSFAMLDIDHFIDIQQKSEDFEVKKIIQKLKKLHEETYKVFCESITKTAIQEWDLDESR